MCRKNSLNLWWLHHSNLRSVWFYVFFIKSNGWSRSSKYVIKLNCSNEISVIWFKNNNCDRYILTAKLNRKNSLSLFENSWRWKMTAKLLARILSHFSKTAGGQKCESSLLTCFTLKKCILQLQLVDGNVWISWIEECRSI